MNKLKSAVIAVMFLMMLTVMPFGVYAAESSGNMQVEDSIVPSASAASDKNGLIKEKGKYYYYVKGKKVINSWKKINGYSYYFTGTGRAVTSYIRLNGKAYVFESNGHLLRKGKSVFYKLGKYTFYVNKNGEAATGWFTVQGRLFYADPKGRIYKNKVRDGVTFLSTGKAKINSASKLKIKTMEIMKNIASPGMSKSQKLRAAWNYVVSSGRFYYRSTDYNIWREGWQKDSAYEMFTMRSGSCTEFATAFAALAAEAGYDPYVVYGRVPGSRDGAADGMTRHCWIEINGLSYDPEGVYAGWSGYVYGSNGYPIYHTVTQRENFKKSTPK